MSAYGAISAPTSAAVLPVLSWPIADGRTLTTYPVRGNDAPASVINYLYGVFSDELEDGKTYPQEGPMTAEDFTAYFFNSTTVVGIVSDGSKATLEEAVAGRDIEEALGGAVYIKPNYPGRSSHNCNGGFVVPKVQRRRKIGQALAKAFLEYAPKLGYRASVFNLVFNNNVASVRLWDSLGFERVGRIPNAGRLKSGPNGEEEYVDAIIMYKSFV